MRALMPSQKKRMERLMGIEPTSPAWKAGALPLSYSRSRGGILPERNPQIRRIGSPKTRPIR